MLESFGVEVAGDEGMVVVVLIQALSCRNIKQCSLFINVQYKYATSTLQY